MRQKHSPKNKTTALFKPKIYQQTTKPSSYEPNKYAASSTDSLSPKAQFAYHPNLKIKLFHLLVKTRFSLN